MWEAAEISRLNVGDRTIYFSNENSVLQGKRVATWWGCQTTGVKRASSEGTGAWITLLLFISYSQNSMKGLGPICKFLGSSW